MAKKHWNPLATEAEPVGEAQPEEPEKSQPLTTAESGLQKIREAINLIKGHSAASVGGSMLSEALKLLEEGYEIIDGDHT